MKMNSYQMCAGGALLLGLTSMAPAGMTVIDYEDLSEGFYGTSLSHMGVTYRDVNLVSGVFPDGSTFEPEDNEQVIIEDATFFYNDFPTWGSGDKAMTFGSSFVPGDNLSIGRLSSVMMDLDTPADFVSMDVAYLENGPWGGIVLHIDALSGGSVVGSDTITFSDLGDRDNPAITVLSVGGVTFDQIHMYATFGTEYSLPRVMIDDLTLSNVPAPGCLTLLAMAGVVSRRRRRD